MLHVFVFKKGIFVKEFIKADSIIHYSTGSLDIEMGGWVIKFEDGDFDFFYVRPSFD